MVDVPSSSVKKSKVKFNASMGFPHLPPYKALFAERVPVLQAFQVALANYFRLCAQRRQAGRWSLLRSIGRGGDVFRGVECGVFTGSSLVACAELARDSGVRFQLIGLDTFCGLPDLSSRDRELAPEGAPYLEKTLFSETSIESVWERLKAASVHESVVLHKGLFRDSLPKLSEQSYHFVNIDCDLYEPHLECLEYFYSRMCKGGVVFFDDYYSQNYPMARQAINDFMIDKPEDLVYLRFGDDAPNRTKAYFVKY